MLVIRATHTHYFTKQTNASFNNIKRIAQYLVHIFISFVEILLVNQHPLVRHLGVGIGEGLLKLAKYVRKRC